MTDKQIDNVYEYLDSAMRLGEFDVIDRIFDSLCIRFDEMDDVAIITYLTASLPVKSKIPNRKLFINKCRTRFKDEFEDLFKGLI